MSTTETTSFYPEDKGLEALAKAREHPVVVVLDGRRTSRRYEIKKSEFTLGRDDTCDLVLHDTSCSRVHAKIVWPNVERAEERPRISVEDLKSTNGVFVNGARVTSRDLRSGDKLLMGKTIVGFFLWDDMTLKAEDALLTSARTDGLTGLYNRGAFESALTKEFQRAMRYGRPLTLVMLDLDRFKEVNDAHGHAAGDKVLREVANLAISSSRSNDMPCRYGGEEIAILLPETPAAGGAAYASRLSTALRGLKVASGGAEIRITGSFGVAEIEPWMREAEHLVKAADMALYQAKRDGRNRVVSHSDMKVEDPESTQPLRAL